MPLCPRSCPSPSMCGTLATRRARWKIFFRITSSLRYLFLCICLCASITNDSPQGNTTKASAVLQQAIHTEPWRSKPRRELATICASTGEAGAAQALLQRLLDRSIVQEMEGMHHALRISAVAASGASLKDEAEAQAQRAVMLAPWDSRNWLCLAYVETLK